MIPDGYSDDEATIVFRMAFAEQNADQENEGRGPRFRTPVNE
jgi:hypothetical protein